MMGSMEQYYIATEDGKTEGPYSFESLEASYTNGKITQKTLVCIVGSQEWVQFRTVLEQKWKEQASKNNSHSSIPEKQKKETELDGITVEVLFKVAGVLSLLAGFILFCSNVGSGQSGIGFIYLLSGALSCLGCFWCAKVIELLSRTVDLLSAIAKRIYNAGNED